MGNSEMMSDDQSVEFPGVMSDDQSVESTMGLETGIQHNTMNSKADKKTHEENRNR